MHEEVSITLLFSKKQLIRASIELDDKSAGISVKQVNDAVLNLVKSLNERALSKGNENTQLRDL